MPSGATPVARLLDLSRLVSRLGAGAPTGIDRVELAYLRRLLASPEPVWALVRTAAGFSLLARDGAQHLLAAADGAHALPARPDLLARLTHRRSGPRPRAETLARQLARASCLRPGLPGLLRAHLPAGTHYLNTGHSNLAPRVMAALRGLAGARIAVLVHDVIPLDHPEHTRADTRASFAARMRTVAATADLTIYNSHDTRCRAERHFAAFGRVPPGLVAHLGPDPFPPPAATLPAGIARDRPWFLSLGTIEPRKNHALLLDLWDRLAADLPPGLPAAQLPQLVIAGRRGWNNAAVFARLDAFKAARSTAVIETGPVDDATRSALLLGARALLFPSHAEGFGMPLAEAAESRIPALCSDLPVFHEIAGDYPVYLPRDDVYPWLSEILRLTAGTTGQRPTPPRLPTWEDHFNRVLSVV